MYYFQRTPPDAYAASFTINNNLIDSMPAILSSSYPALTAAQINVQKEFDRSYKTIVKEKAYQGKCVVFISGLHIDISPRQGQVFPLTKYVPWAAFIQDESGNSYILEQDDLFHTLMRQSTDNPHKIDLSEEIGSMKLESEIKITVDD